MRPTIATPTDVKDDLASDVYRFTKLAKIFCVVALIMSCIATSTYLFVPKMPASYQQMYNQTLDPLTVLQYGNSLWLFGVLVCSFVAICAFISMVICLVLRFPLSKELKNSSSSVWAKEIKSK